jgi:hypothetical protein
MGVIIIVSDLYWTYTSYQDVTWLALGVIILLASIVWIALDFSLARSPSTPKPT